MTTVTLKFGYSSAVLRILRDIHLKVSTVGHLFSEISPDIMNTKVWKNVFVSNKDFFSVTDDGVRRVISLNEILCTGDFIMALGPTTVESLENTQNNIRLVRGETKLQAAQRLLKEAQAECEHRVVEECGATSGGPGPLWWSCSACNLKIEKDTVLYVGTTMRSWDTYTLARTSRYKDILDADKSFK